MASKYWIKLYHEMLHDRKVASLDDHLWRRTVELFLMAGEQNEGGLLPTLDDMTWLLRSSKEELETDLNELIQVGIIEFIDGRYQVRKFSERQAPLDKADYMRRLRDRKQREHYEPVTNPLPEVTQITDIDTDIDLDKETDKDKPKKKSKSIPLTADEILSLVPLPDELAYNLEFTSTWTGFIEHRIEIGKPFTARGAGMALKKLSNYDVKVAIVAIQDSVSGGWQGVFPENVNTKNNGTSRRKSRAELNKDATKKSIQDMKDYLLEDG